MAKIYGGTTTTPINPDMFGGGSGGVSEARLKEYAVPIIKNYEHLKKVYIQGFWDDDNPNGVETISLEGNNAEEFEEQGNMYANSVPVRNSNGNLYTGMPTEIMEAVPKKYVDDIVGDIETTLDSIIAIQNELIGGGSV